MLWAVEYWSWRREVRFLILSTGCCLRVDTGVIRIAAERESNDVRDALDLVKVLHNKLQDLRAHGLDLCGVIT